MELIVFCLETYSRLRMELMCLALVVIYTISIILLGWIISPTTGLLESLLISCVGFILPTSAIGQTLVSCVCLWSLMYTLSNVIVGMHLSLNFHLGILMACLLSIAYLISCTYLLNTQSTITPTMSKAKKRPRQALSMLAGKESSDGPVPKERKIKPSDVELVPETPPPTLNVDEEVEVESEIEGKYPESFQRMLEFLESLEPDDERCTTIPAVLQSRLPNISFHAAVCKARDVKFEEDSMVSKFDVEYAKRLKANFPWKGCGSKEEINCKGYLHDSANQYKFDCCRLLGLLRDVLMLCKSGGDAEKVLGVLLTRDKQTGPMLQVSDN